MTFDVFVQGFYDFLFLALHQRYSGDEFSLYRNISLFKANTEYSVRRAIVVVLTRNLRYRNGKHSGQLTATPKAITKHALQHNGLEPVGLSNQMNGQKGKPRTALGKPPGVRFNFLI